MNVPQEMFASCDGESGRPYDWHFERAKAEESLAKHKSEGHRGMYDGDAVVRFLRDNLECRECQLHRSLRCAHMTGGVVKLHPMGTDPACMAFVPKESKP